MKKLIIVLILLLTATTCGWIHSARKANEWKELYKSEAAEATKWYNKAIECTINKIYEQAN